MIKDKYVFLMACVRILSGCIELGAAVLMLYFDKLATAVRINSSLGLVGPLVFIAVSSIGVIGLSASLPPARLALVIAGVVLVVLGTAPR